MRVLDHTEAVITDDDVNEDWQLKDIAATLRPVLPALAAIDFQMTKALPPSDNPLSSEPTHLVRAAEGGPGRR